ncbi:MAG: 5-(carboxyamino)imidazole ribonucleotide mutase [Bdellovibrionota bacterium]
MTKNNKKILIVLGSESDLNVTSNGLKELEHFAIPYTLRIASAHRSPEFLHGIISDFENQQGQIVICVAGKSAHLAGVVASLTCKPVLAVPVYSKETAGFDALLSMGQMPKGIPVATMGFGNSGFINACLLAAEILGLSCPKTKEALDPHRIDMASKVQQSDKQNCIEYNG